MKRIVKVLTDISRHPCFPVVAFIALAIMGLAAELMALSFTVGDISTLRLRVVLYLADASVFLAFFWFCPPRFRWFALPVVWIISIFVLANTLYYRYWDDLMPLYSIFTLNNYNSFVIDSLGSLMTWNDAFYLIVPAAITLLYFFLRPYRSPALTRPAKITALVSTVILYAIAFSLCIYSTYTWNRLEQHPLTIGQILDDRFGRNSSQIYMWKNNGLCGFLIAQLINYPDTSPITLDDAERQSISCYIDLRARQNGTNILSANKDKNLIVIIVESLNAWTIGKTYGNHSLTPVLSSLVSAEGTISSTAMTAQINDGGSSDGQLIYNTGLLPLLNGVAAQTHMSNRYPSLVDALRPASSAEFIVESAAVYNHRRTSRAYAYDALHDRDSLLADGWNEPAKGADDAVLDYAFDRILTMPRPFLAQITTLSTHYPFDIKGFTPVEWIDSVAPDDPYLNRYLQTVHYADAAIGRFLDRLSASPLASNTVVVIASDHDEIASRRTNNQVSATDLPIVLIILGSGTSARIESPIGQIDVFPTILDVMGVTKDRYGWRGLGQSILSAAPSAAISRTGRLAGHADSVEQAQLRRAFSVSDSIIRSDYFNLEPVGQ